MELSNQVCSLELAKQLKELGVKQESLFYWAKDGGIADWEIKSANELKEIVGDGWTWLEEGLSSGCALSAFTVAELGEMLPEYVNENQFNSWKIENQWHITYSTREKWWHREVSETEADARAKMLIYLLENNLI